MTIVIRREFFDVSRRDVFRIVPLGDIHLGNIHCDEELLSTVTKRIAKEPNTYWIGMGDYLDAINRSDKRFDARDLAPWCRETGDVVGQQVEKFYEYFTPIAHKCLGLVSGNHEESILLRYERDVMSDIGATFKRVAGWGPEYHLRFDYYGWLRLAFYRDKEREHVTLITLNLHHGFGGGRLAGGKALNIQRHVWTHEADVVIFGHSHNIEMQAEAVERLDADDNIITDTRRGVYGGTFLRNAGYAIRKGYLPIPIGGCELYMRPGAHQISERIRIQM